MEEHWVETAQQSHQSELVFNKEKYTSILAQPAGKTWKYRNTARAHGELEHLFTYVWEVLSYPDATTL